MRKAFVFIVGILLICEGLSARDKSEKMRRVSFGAAAGWAYLLGLDDYAQELIHSHRTLFYTLNAAYRALPGDSSLYDSAFGYPMLEGGFLLVDYSHIHLHMENRYTPYISGLGYMAAAYGAFRRDIVRSERFSLSYSLENGIGLSTRPYNRVDNIDNELIGSPVSVYFGLGLQGKCRVARHWELYASVDLKHFSNGALDRPNKGANTVGLSAGLRYYPVPEKLVFPVRNRQGKTFDKYFYCDISVGWAAKSLIDEWFLYYYMISPQDPRYRTSVFPVYSALTATVAPMFRYRLKYASGIGVDYMYMPYVDRLKEVDKEKGMKGLVYSPHSVGISLRHEVFYKRFSLYFSFGYYLFRKIGVESSDFNKEQYKYIPVEKEKPYYETLGLRYTIPGLECVYIGYQVKAHLLKADCMALSVGIRLEKLKKRGGCTI